jgi:hypothetical protein
LAGADPSIRTVLDGTRRVPYWQGGPAYAPWAQGYYSHWGGGDLLIGSAFSGTGSFEGGEGYDTAGDSGGGSFEDFGLI